MRELEQRSALSAAEEAQLGAQAQAESLQGMVAQLQAMVPVLQVRNAAVNGSNINSFIIAHWHGYCAAASGGLRHPGAELLKLNVFSL